MKIPTLFALYSVAALNMLAQSAGVAPAINQFGLDLLRAQAGTTKSANLLISPYSIESALAMAWAGADGRTREEMRRVLHFAGDETTVVAGFAALVRELDQVQAASRERAENARRYGGSLTPIELNVANRLFLQSGFALRPAFTGVLRENFAAPLEELDFIRAAEPARLTINAWVARETRDRIRDLVPPGALDASTRLVLTNALYLKAPWQNPFKPERTPPAPFWIGGTAPVDVATMTQQRHYGYDRRNGFTALALPYEGGELQFLILLPDERDGLAQLERAVTPEMLAGCARLPGRDVILHLPKFKLTPPSTPLGSMLRGLGMTTAFDDPRGSADFGQMAPRTPKDYLSLSEVFHQTWLAVDETGTEAAAATATVVMYGAMAREPPSPVEVRVDHPFLFAIQHVASGTCLFLGRVTDPR